MISQISMRADLAALAGAEYGAARHSGTGSRSSYQAKTGNLGGAIIGLLVPTFFTISLATSLFESNRPTTGFFGMLVVDQYGLFFEFLFLLVGFGVMLLSLGYIEKYLRVTPGEFFAVMLFSLAGMMLMGSTGELITIYISLELTSIPLYILAGLSRTDGRSAEAAVKYVLLGAMSSAILLYGMALLYGVAGTTDLSAITAAITNPKNGILGGNLMLLAGAIFIFVGLGFKISAVPFHMWAPDIYEGAPTPATLFFSVGSKAAGFAALLRIFVFGGVAAVSGQVSLGDGGHCRRGHHDARQCRRLIADAISSA